MSLPHPLAHNHSRKPTAYNCKPTRKHCALPVSGSQLAYLRPDKAKRMVIPNDSDAEKLGSQAAVASTSDALMLPHEPLMGQDKWLGGALGRDGCIYGVPGHAKHVVRLDPKNGEVTLVGPHFDGKYKWLRGDSAPTGTIYGIPCHADRVLAITPSDGKSETLVETIGDALPGKWKWHGGVYSPHDKCVYAIPQASDTVLKIDTVTNEVSTIGGPFEGVSPTGRHKWYGGLLAGDGSIIGVPTCANSVLRIDPVSQEVSTFGELDCGGWKWHGGVVGPDGCVYGIPFNSDAVLKIDARERVVDYIPIASYTCNHREDGKYKYLGGVVGPDDRIYAIPCDAERVLRIDPSKNEAVEIGPAIRGAQNPASVSDNGLVTLNPGPLDCNKWQNGFVGKDGNLYFIPLKAESVLRVNPWTEEMDLIGGPFPGFEKWEGGVMDRDGNMFCIPLNAKRFLRITPTTAAS